MLDVTHTITINGEDGDRFLSSLSRYGKPLPRELEALATGERRSIEVDRTAADQIARFVDDVLAAGWIAVQTPPLLFSPVVGDRVLALGDTLVELGRQAVGLPPTWFCIPAGTRGTLLGWRDRESDTRAIVALDAPPESRDRDRVILFVSATRITRASGGTRGHGAASRVAARRARHRRNH